MYYENYMVAKTMLGITSNEELADTMGRYINIYRLLAKNQSRQIKEDLESIIHELKSFEEYREAFAELGGEHD